MATKKESSKKERIDKLVKDGEEKAKVREAEIEAAAKTIKPVSKSVERSEHGPIASRFAKQCESAAVTMNVLAKSIKEKVFTLIELENKAHSLNLKTQDAERNLARLEADAQRAIAMGTAGVRQIAGQVAKQQDENEQLRSRLADQEKTLAGEILANQELKAHYETKLAQLGKVASAIPGD